MRFKNYKKCSLIGMLIFINIVFLGGRGVATTVQEWVKKAKTIYEKSVSEKKEIGKKEISLIIKYCKNALEIETTSPEAHFWLGWAYDRNGLYDKATKEFEEVIKSAPNYEEAHIYLGGAYMIKDLHKNAIKEYKKVIKINPKNAEAHFWLGVEYLEIGKKRKALKEYKILKELDKEKADNLFKLINDK